MVIDSFCHVIPAKYTAAVEKLLSAGKISPLNALFSGEFKINGMTDMANRFEMMDATPEVKQVLSVTGPFLEVISSPEDSVQLAKIANDEVAVLVAKYPDRFLAGVGFLPGNNIEACLREIDRCIVELKFRGIEIGTDFNGKPLDAPEFSPIFEKMEKYDLPIFMHPSKNYFATEYPGETESKYNLVATLGWPHATSVAMMRLVYSGIFDKFPKLKIVTHHAGGTVPFLAKRIESNDLHILARPVTDYLKLFYNDIAVQGNVPNLMCALAFFGADHLLFGTDFPFGKNNVQKALAAVAEMPIPASDKQKILEGNAKKLLRLH